MSNDASWVGLDVTTSQPRQARVRTWGSEGLPVLELHQIENVCAASDEENLHDGVVERYPASKDQIHISSTEYGEVECLGFIRDSCMREEILQRRRSLEMTWKTHLDMTDSFGSCVTG